jgi:hypothetical protein
MIEFPSTNLESRQILTRPAADLAEKSLREPTVRLRTVVARGFVCAGRVPCEKIGSPGKVLFVVA